MQCPRCQSFNVMKNGIYKGRKQRYKCRECHKGFVDNYEIKKVTVIERQLLEKICKTCGKSFLTTNNKRKRCDKCVALGLKKMRESINFCYYCGRHICGNWKRVPIEERVCSFCRAEGKGKRAVKGSMESKLELVSGVVVCPNCREPMEIIHSRWNCVNDECPVIYVTQRKGFFEILRDSAMAKEVCV